MFNKKLKGKKIAILATDGFEHSELFEPREALEKAGAHVQIVSLKKNPIRGWKDKDWGKKINVDLSLDEASAENFDALMIPGGVMNPDKLRTEVNAVEFVREFAASGKPIAAICHAPALLIEADVVRGKKMTSWPSLKTDLINAGAYWFDEEVIVDKGLVTSRKPDDIPAFNRKMIEEFAEGLHLPRREQPDNVVERGVTH